MRRTLTAVGLSLIATLAVAGWASGSSDISAPQTLHLVSVIKQGTILDLGPSGPSLGDEQVASGALLHSGQQVGRFSFVCTWTGIHPTYANEHCDGGGKVTDGQITFDGLTQTDHERHVWAVTGGTGTYRNARGEVRITDLSDTRSRVVVELIP
jgi:hypothetical protein